MRGGVLLIPVWVLITWRDIVANKNERKNLNLITIDFETFYDTGYGLNRLTTEEYIHDIQFQVIGVAIKINDGKRSEERRVGKECRSRWLRYH